MLVGTWGEPCLHRVRGCGEGLGIVDECLCGGVLEMVVAEGENGVFCETAGEVRCGGGT